MVIPRMPINCHCAVNGKKETRNKYFFVFSDGESKIQSRVCNACNTFSSIMDITLFVNILP